MMGVDVEADITDDIAGKFHESINQVFLEAADAGFETSQEKAPVDQGDLLRSGIPPKMMQDGTIVWGYVAPHSDDVEFGSAPHIADFDAIKGWARRVIGSEAAAGPVWRKIAREGTEPQPFVRPGVERMRRRLKGQDIPTRISDNL